MGHGPYSLWLLAFAAVWAFVPATLVFAWKARPLAWCGLLVILWSGYIDFWFFRRVLSKTALQAGRDLLVQRLISWAGILALFLGSAGWQVIATRLGL